MRNIVAGLTGIDPAIIEAARGMGMNTWQTWWRVQIPLALPVILAGVRIAAVVCIGIATIGAKFNAGGLGVLLFQGISQGGRADKIWAGALLVGGLGPGGQHRAAAARTRPLASDARAQRRASPGCPARGNSGAESEVLREGAGIRG